MGGQHRVDNSRRRQRTVVQRGAFSLLELVVVIGVVMILMSLLMPGLGGAVSEGKLTRDLALMRSHAASIAMYAESSRGFYPYWSRHPDPTLAARSWYVPMMSAGYFSSRDEIEPGLEGSPFDTVEMSMCMVYDWKLMRPGETVPEGNQRSMAVPTRTVSYPSLKGLVFRAFSGPPFDEQTGLQTDVQMFCCADLWVFPVAMADGSAQSGNYLQFNDSKPLEQEQGIGVPVWTTWMGVRGIDRW